MFRLVVLAILFCVVRGDPIVVTNAGSVRGTVHASGVQAYLGIPFAQPPVGNLRFAPPQQAAAWSGVRDATQFGFACMQDPSALMGYYYGPQSEDCLTINVFVPPGNKTNLDVMVWIYGGKFTTGSSRFPQYNGESLALDGVVVVTFNYRVGPWGFFVSDELLLQDQRNVNMALQDQQLALQWVQANIAAFRGDPKKVTLFGESAGSVSISLHLLMEGSQNLFRRVAMESASAFQDSTSGVTVQAPYQLSTYKAYSKAWLAECNCTTVACARALPKETLLAVQLARFPDWKPQIDGTIITDDPLVLLRAGKFQKNVDILYGNNADEGTLFVNLSYTADDMVKATQEMFGSKNADKILKQYSSGYDSPGYAFAAIYGDYLMNCPGRRMLRTVAKQSPASQLYQFEWRHLPSWIRCPGIFCKGPAGVPQRVAHFTEIAFVFGVANPWPAPAPAGYNMTDAEAALSSYMRGAWVQFASTGSMNADWPSYTDSGAYMPLQTLMPRPIEYNYDQSNCDMWDSLTAASSRDTDYTLWYSIGAGVLVLIIAIVVHRRRAASNSREGLLSASIQETDNYRPLTH